MKPFEGVFVLDFSQFLSGPSVGLRLADLGATVVKVERCDSGDSCRHMYVSNVVIDGESSIFHARNRNKEDIAVDLKNVDERNKLLPLLKKADVLLLNFRPGVAERLGLDYESVRSINPSIVYGQITGYGTKGPFKSVPGQDLLAQSLSGLCYLNGNEDQPPTPFGLGIVDMFTGQHLAQGVFAALIRRELTGQGACVQGSLLESALDIQFELFTTFLNNGHKLPKRCRVNNANAYINAPYGIYETADGYLALAMVPIPRLAELISCKALETYCNPADGYEKRDEIKQLLADFFKTQTTQHWLSLLEPADVWCSDVFTWDKMMESEGFKELDAIQTVYRKNGTPIQTTRCPIRIDGEIYKSSKGAPVIGEDNDRYLI